MIRDVEGDILLSQADIIAHGVAPHDHFDSGLALALRERYPAMAKDFRHYCQQNHPKPGEIWSWAGAKPEGGTVRIINLLTQEPSEGAGGKPGKASLPNVNHALKALAQMIGDEKPRSVALPRLATGVGGLDWADVRPLIEKHLAGLDAEVILYTTYRKGVAA
ncbi:macro domain-containing protein [Ferrovibrio sp.]|uniref:macro domain-containing protein n=1 Tax=Ferrovibrio sp. TaxID=1917215 RepID=UPI0025BC80D7|nr:macro domain-containing protein [Ferrovibrio sp.]MBX3453731.1 macro domain-containing protein [Ferrovibrio sp.]